MFKKSWFRELKEMIKEILLGTIHSRMFWLGAVLTGLCILLIGRLFQLQILEGQSYQDKYIQKTRKEITLTSTRGRIFDSNGNVLADNLPAYAVTVKSGYYKTNAELNQALLEMIRLLEEHGESLETTFPVTLGEDNVCSFTLNSEAAVYRFFRDDVFGVKSVEELTEEQKATTADQVFAKFKSTYGLTSSYEKDGQKVKFTGWLDRSNHNEPVEISEEDAMKIVNIRYAMRVLTYNKSQSVKIASNVSESTVAAVKENADRLLGMDVEQETIRVYPDAEYFSHIIGYTGTASQEDLDKFNGALENEGKEGIYKSGDIVGRSGMEQKMELDLQGKKGTQTVYMDSVGHILEVEEDKTVEAVNGNDVTLSIDKDLQIGMYHILEQSLASILLNKLTDGEFTRPTEKLDADLWKIPVKDLYFQLINNNILDMDHFSGDKASETEKTIHQKFTERRQLVLQQLEEQLTVSPQPVSQLSEEMQSYMEYLYSYLASSKKILLTAQIDKNDAVYQQWINDEISLRDFLYAAIEKNWIDTTQIQSESAYSNTDQIYRQLVEQLLESLPDNKAFSKVIYDSLVHQEVVTGNELCLALFDQGVLEYDQEAVQRLSSGGHAEAFEFVKEKIGSLELTPAQLALDPCSGSVIITDVNTGKVKALVTYPGYDNNKMSGKVDADYYRQLSEDLSSPFLNEATQISMAPGSTFKMVTAAAGLCEGVINLNTKVDCTVVFDKITPSPKCWKLDGGHGEQNVVQAIANSCNFFFYEVGYRLCLDELGQYNEELGLQRLAKYSEMFGFSEKSGIEVDETGNTQISDSLPVPSAIGQGTNAYSPIQMARYVTALANKGSLFELSILENEKDAQGNVTKEFQPQLERAVELPDWVLDNLQQGMHDVVYEGSIAGFFSDLDTVVAGKTGTAQENLSRADHAQFISFAPYESPEISMVVMIPHGYTSGYTATAAKELYKYYFGQITLEEVKSRRATADGYTSVGD